MNALVQHSAPFLRSLHRDLSASLDGDLSYRGIDEGEAFDTRGAITTAADDVGTADVWIDVLLDGQPIGSMYLVLDNDHEEILADYCGRGLLSETLDKI